MQSIYIHAGHLAPYLHPSAVLQVTQILPLADALDTPGWIWITGGSQPWIGQPLVARDGVSAARGGVVTNNQTTSLQTTVIGPGTIGFAWKVSSETNTDTLRFLIGATEQARISGEVDWNRRNFSIPAGSQVLQWTYSKNGSLAAGRDLAWVDEVGFAASLAPAELQPATTNISAPTVVQITMSGTKVTLVWDANPTKTYKVLYKDSVSETEWQVVDGEVLVRWKIANGIVSPDSVTATVVDVLAGTSRFYRVLEE